MKQPLKEFTMQIITHHSKDVDSVKILDFQNLTNKTEQYFLCVYVKKIHVLTKTIFLFCSDLVLMLHVYTNIEKKNKYQKTIDN